ncbi:MAG TPA: DnaJ domain-containing protein [Polyangia bacterium]|nr:DnaJ domain-containing protein [Polyangia bacterium]
MRAPPTVDLYLLLGVSRSASGAEIRRAYRKLALLHHPDRAGAASAQKFASIAEAYRMLSDPTARSAYDAHLLQRESQSAFAPGAAQAQAQGDGRSWTVSGPGWSASFERSVPNVLPRVSGPIDRLQAVGVARLTLDGLLELSLNVAEAAAGGSAVVEMPLKVMCPTCGGVASPRGVWCVRCEHAGIVTESVAVVVPIPRAARDGMIVTASLRRAGVAQQRARIRVAG